MTPYPDSFKFTICLRRKTKKDARLSLSIFWIYSLSDTQRDKQLRDYHYRFYDFGQNGFASAQYQTV